MKNLLYVSPSADGWHNLAVDEWLLDHLEEDAFLLSFYVNENAVIIGRNQNPWKECALDAMARDGVQLVRRVTGGGAVYHDTGNLNYSLIAGQGRYDQDGQYELILRALRSLGIPCERSGRNDLLAGGRKFSGSAFCQRGNIRQHHGTLLVGAALDRLPLYLQPDPRKLRAKGVGSVRGRVCNLSSFRPGLQVDEVREALIEAYSAALGRFEPWSPDTAAGLAPYEERHRSWEWRMGKTPAFDLELERRFPWGGVQLLFTLREGRVASLETYTDALDERLSERLRACLTGQRLDAGALGAALAGAEDEPLRDIAAWLAGERL